MKQKALSTKKDNEMMDKNLDLMFEFTKYVLEHPELDENIPDNAIIIMQSEGDEAFNEWNKRLGEKQAKEAQPIIYVLIKRMGPLRSRIEELELV